MMILARCQQPHECHQYLLSRVCECGGGGKAVCVLCVYVAVCVCVCVCGGLRIRGKNASSHVYMGYGCVNLVGT